jgi:hypothetical protein
VKEAENNMQTEAPSAEWLADYFVDYILDKKSDSRHVRRVASWIGFIISAIGHVAESYDKSYSRQLVFFYRGERFKVKYAHDASFRGGIEIIHMDGVMDLRTVITATNLAEAEQLYLTLKDRLDAHLER